MRSGTWSLANKIPEKLQMKDWFGDGKKLIALSIVFAVLVFGWMFRFEQLSFPIQKNRFTGAVCDIKTECWFSSN